MLEFAVERTPDEEIDDILDTLDKVTTNYRKKLNEVTDSLIEAYRWNDHCDRNHSWPPLFRKQIKDIIEKRTKMDIGDILKHRNKE